jgi:radical SAM protein with 4Fe4S-binding SPASM domain
MFFKKRKKDVVLEVKRGKVFGPEKVMISPTDSCNLRCKTCWRIEKKGYDKIKDELTFDEISRILKECKKLGVKTIDLTGGGEPFYRKNITDIIKLVKDYGFEATLTTNGTLLNEEKIRNLINIGLDDLCFSLESGEEKINDSLRGKGTYKQAVHAIKTLNTIKRDSKKPVIRIATVITNKNYKHISSLVNLAVENKISMISFSVMIEWETNRHLSMKKKKNALEVLKKLNQDLKSKGVSSNLEPIIKYGLFEHEPPKFCFAPWEMIFINSNGEVLACCTLASHHENVIGNIKEQSLQQIWCGEKMNRFRKMIKNKKYFEECRKCLPEFTEKYNKLYERLKNE